MCRCLSPHAVPTSFCISPWQTSKPGLSQGVSGGDCGAGEALWTIGCRLIALGSRAKLQQASEQLSLPRTLTGSGVKSQGTT